MQGIRLNQHVAELDAAEEPFEGSRLAALVSGIGGLGNRHPQWLPPRGLSAMRDTKRMAHSKDMRLVCSASPE